MTDDKAGARSSPEPEVGSGRSGRSGRFWRGRLLRGFGGLAITALALGLGLFAWLHEPRPTGETGARAEALAARVEAAVLEGLDIAAHDLHETFYGPAESLMFTTNQPTTPLEMKVPS